MNNKLQRLTNRHLSRWMEYRDEDRTADENIGRADGENNIPSVNTHTWVFQDTLFHNAIADLISYNNKRCSYIRALNQKERDLVDKLSRYRFRYTQLLQANDRVIKFINETMGDDSADMKEAQNAVERTWQKLHALESQLGRPLRTSMVTPYPFVMSLLSMVEVPINRFAFELFFLQQPAISNIIALAVGVILIAFAHVIGLLMRRATNYVTIKDRSGLYIGSATAILPSSAIIYFLGLMREQYLKIISADQTTNFADLLNQGFQGVESVGKGIAVVQNIAAINLSSAGMSSLPPGDRIVINTIADSYTRSRKIFDSCLPGCPEGKFLDWLFGSCLPVLARMDGQNFRKELVQRLRDLLKATESYPNSDIARTIAEVTKIYNMSSNMKTIHTLVIVSDMIENSDVVPHQSIFSERSDKIIRRFSQAGIEVNLQGAEVQVLGVGRDDTPERRPLGPEVRRKLKEIWTSWLKMGGASSVKFK